MADFATRIDDLLARHERLARVAPLQELIGAWQDDDGPAELARAWYELCKAMTWDDDLVKEVIPTCRKAIELHPDPPLPWRVELATFLQWTGEHAASVAELDLVVEADPTIENAVYNRANGWFYQGKLDEAIADYSWSIELNPTDVDAWFNRGVARWKRIERDTGSYGAQTTDDATLYGPAGAVDEVVADYTQALEIDPTFTKALVNRAMVYRDTAREELAIADLRRAADLGDRRAPAALEDLFGIDLADT